jgi:putative spermidine/putrescine transport system ATP-binding protein
MSHNVEIRGLAKTYGQQHALRDLDLDITAGEFYTLLGSSGSGKTTTLMAIAGFVEPDRGSIRIGGRDVLGLAPEKRGLGVVFQSYALFPTMDVANNVAFPLKMRGVAREEIVKRVRRALQLVHLDKLGERRVTQLSGGQQQRVALARAIVFEPPVLLMDEPLGALDRQLREELQIEIRRLQRALGLTVCYVTHDQEEALSMSDRVAVMADASLQQVGSPAEVYERPANLFVARFLGESNILACRPVASGQVELAGCGVVTQAAAITGIAQPAHLLLRPEALRVTAEAVPGGLPARVEQVDYLGASIRVMVSSAAGPVVVRLSRLERPAALAPGGDIHLSWQPEDARLFDGAGHAL